MELVPRKDTRKSFGSSKFWESQYRIMCGYSNKFFHSFQGRPRGEMMVEERIEAADRRRVDGNEFFKENKFEEAIQQYEMVRVLICLICRKLQGLMKRVRVMTI